MPGRSRRNVDSDPLKSDTEDETYGAKAPGSTPRKDRKSKSQRPIKSGKWQQRKFRRAIRNESTELSESEASATNSSTTDDEIGGEDYERQQVDLNSKGRPQRHASKIARPIVEDDSDQMDMDMDQMEAGDDNESEQDETLIDHVVGRPSLPIVLRYSKQNQHERADSPGRKLNGINESARESRHHSQSRKKPSQHRATSRKSGATYASDNDTDEIGMPEDEISRLNTATSQTTPNSDVRRNKQSDKPGVDGSREATARTNKDDKESDAMPRRTRTRSTAIKAPPGQAPTILGKRKTRNSHKSGDHESSDFEPAAEEATEEDMSNSASSPSPQKPNGKSSRIDPEDDDGDDDDDDDDEYRVRRTRAKRSHKAPLNDNKDDDDEDAEHRELLEEVNDLHARRSRRSQNLEIIMQNNHPNKRRRVNKVNYDIMAHTAAISRVIDEAEDDYQTSQDISPSKGRSSTAPYGRSLLSTYGPFGGGGTVPVLGDANGLCALGGAVSDSSDDDIVNQPASGVAANDTGPSALMGLPSNPGGMVTPGNLGKVKDKQSLADADPLGVDQNVNFDGVGGLGGHINQLKEMVMLPLLYPEIFLRFHVTPPRGVLFHGPPGTGKTLLARALASSIGTHDRKVTFFMRKGADALSKWVGEAERQLRLLFEEARKTQPSIIFFDEIDGLAPVRSSKQEQIHASIVSTLLALMDGMDGRGQVIVIGATNRPDSIDPALRRPGRFDREFYFPLPNVEARRTILDIHTKHWSPALTPEFKDKIAVATKGYGGADLRALCTEAALNAVQRSYPQIYASDVKLLIDPQQIKVSARDFMMSIKKLVPSSERSVSSSAAPLPTHLEPLLEENLSALHALFKNILPYQKPPTALEEAAFEPADSFDEMGAETLRQDFDRCRVFRPRLLVHGQPGMGQQYLMSALLNRVETVHVQVLDMPALYGDSTRSAESTIVQTFTEAKRRKPSIIYIPQTFTWFATVDASVLSVLQSLVRGLMPNDPVMLLGVVDEEEVEGARLGILDEFCGEKAASRYQIALPSKAARRRFFAQAIQRISMPPNQFPEAQDRRKRKLPVLPPAPVVTPENRPTISHKDLKAQKRKDRYSLNQLKMYIQPIMNEIKKKYRKFRLGVIDEKEIRYLFEDGDDAEIIITSDLVPEQGARETRPFEKATDKNGEPGLRSTAHGKFFYNMDITIIERRLCNGYYKRAPDFLNDVKKIAKDAKCLGDSERILRALELQNNVEVDMHNFEINNPALVAELEAVRLREISRENDKIQRLRQAEAEKEKEKMAEASTRNMLDSHKDVSRASLSQAVVGHENEQASSPQPSVSGQDQCDIDMERSSLESPMIHDHEESNRLPKDGAQSASKSVIGAEPATSTSLSMSSDAQTNLLPTSSSHDLHYIKGAPESRPTDSDQSNGRLARTQQNGSSRERNTQATSDGPDLSMFVASTDTHSQVADTIGDTQPSSLSVLEKNNSPGVRVLPATRSIPPSQFNSSSLPEQDQSNDEEKLQNGHLDRQERDTMLTNDVQNADTQIYQNDDDLVRQILDQCVSCTADYTIEHLDCLYSLIMNGLWETRGDWDRISVAHRISSIIAQDSAKRKSDLRQRQEQQT